MRAATGFDGGDAGVREGGVGVEEIGVFATGEGGEVGISQVRGAEMGPRGESRVGEESRLPSEDVVGDCGDGEFVTELEAKLEHQGGFAGADRSAVEEGGWSAIKRRGKFRETVYSKGA